MNVFINAFQSVLSIITMIALGYYLTRRGLFDENASRLFGKLVINVSLPAMMIANILSVFSRESLYSAGIGLAIPFASMFICYIAAVGTARLVGVRQDRRGIFQMMFFASNTIFMGMPVNLALFGEKSIPYVLYYYAANTTLFWTLGIYGISTDSKGANEKSGGTGIIKKIFSPPLLGFLAGLLLVALEVKLPSFLMDSFKYIGNLTTPLSLLFIGITFNSVDFKSIRFDKDMAALLFGRFVLSPLLVYALSLLIPVPGLMLKVFIIQSAMPVITQSAIVAKAYDIDYHYATVMVTVTTILSMIFIPVYMVLMNRI